MSDWVKVQAGGLTQQALSEAIFAGRVLYFEQLAAMAEVIREVQALLRAAFTPHEPESAHEFLSAQEHEARFVDAQRKFAASESIKQHIHTALIAAGADSPETYCDRLRLRAAPPHALNTTRLFFRASTPAHRDSWGSAIRCQINWWFPVFPLQRDRTLVIYPAHWSMPIANNVPGWDWTKIGKDPNVPRAPTAQAPIDTRDEIRVTISPGTLAAFSAAHLHAGLVNTTSRTRFSIETRTVNLDDMLADRGAPAIDGLAAQVAYEWFFRISDNRPLAEVAVARQISTSPSR